MRDVRVPRGWADATALALGCLLLIQVLGIYLPSVTTVYGSAGSTSAYQLGGFAALWFVVAFAVLPVVAAFGRRAVGAGGPVVAAAVALAVCRLALQGTDGGEAQLYLSSCAVLAAVVWLALSAMRGMPGPHAAAGIAAGLAVSAVQHTLLGTVDLMWRPGAWPWVVVVAEAAAFVAVSWLGRRRAPGGTGPARIWLVAGPMLALSPMIFASPARAQVAWSSTAHLGPALVALVAVLALPLALPARWRWQGTARSAGIAGIGLLVALVLAVFPNLESGGPARALPWFAVIGQLLGIVCLYALLGAAGRTPGEVGRYRRGTGALCGMLALFVVLFLYYASYDTDLGFPRVAILFAAVCFVGVLAVHRRPGAVPRAGRRLAMPAVLTVVVALLVGGSTVALQARRLPAVHDAAPGRLRMVTYNIRMGVGLHGRFDTAAIARALRAQHPDVVLLNEVDRGWLLNGGHDALDLLAARLHMRAVFAPAADPIWGDAILTDLPVHRIHRHRLPAYGGPTGAQAVSAVVDTGIGPVAVVATHLQPPPDAPPTGQARRVGAVAAGLADTGLPVVVAGDMNAKPGSPPMRAFAAAGLHDGLAGYRPLRTYPSDRPVKQIDQVLVHRLTVTAATAPAVTSSDHRPVAFTLSRATS